MKNGEDPSLRVNVKLFRKIQRAIRKEQGAFEMSWWAETPGDSETKSKEHPCFTTACMAGWAVFEQDGRLPKEKTWGYNKNGEWKKNVLSVNVDVIPKKAIQALGITARQGSVLFVKNAWPSEMRGRSGSLGNRNGKSDAENAIEVIDRFLAAGGRIDWPYPKDKTISLGDFE